MAEDQVKKEEKQEKKQEEKKKNKPVAKEKKKTKKDNLISPWEVQPGMVIKLWQKIKEVTPKGEQKERLQFFEGIVLARKGGNKPEATITLRKTSFGIGVEKVFPLALPTISKIELLHRVRVRRAKLYYLRRGYKKRLKKIYS